MPYTRRPVRPVDEGNAVLDPRDLAKTAYISGMRAVRSVSRRTGLLDRLDDAFRRDRVGVAGHLRSLLAVYDVEDMASLDVPWWTYAAATVVEDHLRRLGGTVEARQWPQHLGEIRYRCGF